MEVTASIGVFSRFENFEIGLRGSAAPDALGRGTPTDIVSGTAAAAAQM
jgi:hypothetical protein